MAKTGVSKFRFISPGIQIAEIDNSQLPREPQAMGPVIIGSAIQGPALRPVKVDSFSEFVEIFGMPQVGNKGGDIWREGVFGLAPTYGAYAAQAWLRNNGAVTFVRLLGKANSGGTVANGGLAGWKIGSSYAKNYTSGAAMGLWLINSASDFSASENTGTLAAIFYCDSGQVALSGNVYGSSSAGLNANTTASAGHLIMSRGTGITFSSVVKTGSAGSVDETISFDFNESSKKYIRKVFNTNPTLINPAGRQYASSNTQTYVLGETFDRDVDEYITNTGGDASRVLGVMLPLSNDNTDTNVNQSSLIKSSTGWVISQDLGAYASYGPLNDNIKKLFRFRSLEGGSWNQKNIKISIRNVRSAPNEFQPYGTFTVEIRDANDSDNDPVILESFTGCNLNPYSDDYIGRKIGDAYAEWSDTDRRYRDFGNFPNKSKFVYVVLDADVDAAAIDQEILPFGYYGPLRFRGFGVSSSAASESVTLTSDNSAITAVANTNAVLEYAGAAAGGSGTSLVYWDNSGTLGAHATPFTGAFMYPRTHLRRSTEQGTLSSPLDAYFGLDTTRSGSSTRFEASYVDVVGGLPDELRSETPGTQVPTNTNEGPTEYQYVFSLDNITRYSGSVATSIDAADTFSSTQAWCLSGSRAAGKSLTATGSSPSYKAVLDAEFDQFTMPMFGGFDGVDIEQRDPFNDYTLGLSENEVTNYAFNSVKMAIDSCADPEVVEYNLMSVPGTTTTGITNHVLNVCRNRADSLAVIDIEGNYTPREDRSEYYTNDSDSNIRGSVSTAVSTLNNRVINNSYGVTYYPWLRYVDQNSGLDLWGPPSIAAIGTYSSAQANSELWFAPAGFTRGGLSEGAAGLPVIGVKERLTSKDRDNLYDANINPIASFPAEGIVIFGQKTLQTTRSALDRVNVRRLMIYVKKEISRMAATLLFDQNVQMTWDRFTGQVVPFLDNVKLKLGLTDFKVMLDKTTTTPDLIDRNIMYAKIYLKPARSIEFIAIDFVITNSGAAFED